MNPTKSPIEPIVKKKRIIRSVRCYGKIEFYINDSMAYARGYSSNTQRLEKLRDWEISIKHLRGKNKLYYHIIPKINDV